MFKDIISYQLAEGITKTRLMEVADSVFHNWMKTQEGFISWEISETEDGYVDIVSWESQEHAKMAEAKMGEIPNAMDWFSCYKEGSMKTQRTNQIKSLG